MGRLLPAVFASVLLVPGWVDPERSFASETVAPAWSAVDVGFGTKPAFDFDAQDRVHVMTMTETVNGGIWHGAADSVQGPWDLVPVSTGYFYGPGDLRVGSDGTAHLAWHNHDEQDPNHLTVDAQGNATIYRIDSPGHNGWDNSLAIDGSGTLHQTSVYPSGFGATTSLEYGTFDGSAWQYDVVPDSEAFMYGFSTSVATDSEDRPHAVYTLAPDWTAPGDLNYAFQDADGWHVTTVVSEGIRGRFPSLAVDGMDRPHVAWLDIDEDDTSRGWVRYGVLDDGVWTVETIDTLEHVSLGFRGGRKQVSLELQEDGQPRVAYGDRRVLRVATRSDGIWSAAAILESTEDLYNGLVVLRLDSHDDPAAVFWQDDPGEVGLVRFVAQRPALMPGDMDYNHLVDFDDIDDFVLGLADASSYYAIMGVGPEHQGDIDGNGVFDFDDIDPFVSILVEGAIAGRRQAVPEPSSLALAAIALWSLVVIRWQRRAGAVSPLISPHHRAVLM